MFVPIVVTTQDASEKAAGLSLLQIYAQNGAALLAGVVCDQSKTATVFSVATACVLSDRDVLSVFLERSLSLASLDFAAAAIWESGVACEGFLNQVSVDGLMGLCGKEPLWNVACLIILEMRGWMGILKPRLVAGSHSIETVCLRHG
jgi:hypothetical protein